MKLPEIPKEYLVLTLLIALFILACFKIDSYITALLSMVAGYLCGVKMEQLRKV